MSLDPEIIYQDHTIFYDSLLLSLIEKNLWISVLTKPAWSSFTRSTRLTVLVMAMSLIALSNMMWYGQETNLNTLEIGRLWLPYRLSFLQSYSRTQVQCHSVANLTECWLCSKWVRPLIYVSANSIIVTSLCLTVLYGLDVTASRANVWMASQFFALFLDVFVLPMIKIVFASSFMSLFSIKMSSRLCRYLCLIRDK